MKNNYIIKKINTTDFNFVCFSIDRTRPNEYFNKVETELKKQNAKGNILFDLLKSNTSSNRRFFKVIFDGNVLDLNNAQILQKVDLDFETLYSCQHFYSSH